MIVWRVIILSALAYGNEGEVKSRKKRIDEGKRFKKAKIQKCGKIATETLKSKRRL